jgi:hemolysin activation/secretion protein
MGLPRQTLAAYLQVDAADRPDLPNLLYLGGEDGLRGYANHLHLGDRRWILSVEERPITPINWLGILQLGFVAFLDAGAIRRADTGRWSRTYANLGGGLRFGDLKSSLGRVFLVTVAYPLVRDPGMDRYQVVIGNVVKF